MNVRLTASLSTIAVDINVAHEQVEQCIADGLGHARRAGALLLKADALGHGEWLPWLATNTTVSSRVAQYYMKVAKNWSSLQAANTNRGSYLPLRTARTLLASSPRSTPTATTPDDRRRLTEILGVSPKLDIQPDTTMWGTSQGMNAWIVPFRTGLKALMGTRRPISVEYAREALVTLDFPLEGAAWDSAPADASNRWAYNQLLYKSKDEARRAAA